MITFSAAEKFEEEASKHWDSFYQKHQNRSVDHSYSCVTPLPPPPPAPPPTLLLLLLLPLFLICFLSAGSSRTGTGSSQSFLNYLGELENQQLFLKFVCVCVCVCGDSLSTVRVNCHCCRLVVGLAIPCSLCCRWEGE